MSPQLHNERIVDTVARLRETSDEPLCAYVYDLQALRQHAQWMKRALPAGCEFYYAAKANAEAPILHTLAPLVDGFEASSGGELRWLNQQQPNKPLLFSGPGKLDSELALAISLPDCTVHLESLDELARLAHLAADAGKIVPICLRMNIAVASLPHTPLMMGGKPTPFGMDEETLPLAVEHLRRHPQLRLEGFHFHLMSHQCDADVQLTLVSAYLDAVRRWRHTYALDVRVVNAGGGFGVDYCHSAHSFDWMRFCEGLRRLRENADDSLVLRFEPGRYVSVACGYYVTQVLDIKRNHGEWFAVTRGGTHHFRTPAAQGHDHPFFVLPGGGLATIRQQNVTLVGQLCTPKDVFARMQPVEALAIGDCVAFPLAGAYAWNISHQQFLMHPPPQMIFLASDADVANTTPATPHADATR